MATKANAGDVERPNRQADDLPSLKDETVCDGLPPDLLKVPTGIVGTAIDADNHALTIDYDPRLISDESIRHWAGVKVPGYTDTRSTENATQRYSPHEREFRSENCVCNRTRQT
jgi:hypothetical protein